MSDSGMRTDINTVNVQSGRNHCRTSWGYDMWLEKPRPQKLVEDVHKAMRCGRSVLCRNYEYLIRYFVV